MIKSNQQPNYYYNTLKIFHGLLVNQDQYIS